MRIRRPSLVGVGAAHWIQQWMAGDAHPKYTCEVCLIREERDLFSTTPLESAIFDPEYEYVDCNSGSRAGPSATCSQRSSPACSSIRWDLDATRGAGSSRSAPCRRFSSCGSGDRCLNRRPGLSAAQQHPRGRRARIRSRSFSGPCTAHGRSSLSPSTPVRSSGTGGSSSGCRRFSRSPWHRAARAS